jgi:hypothetical protein
MRTFGPFYPQELQGVVSHAERLAELLAEEESRGGGSDLADAWLAGRAGEVERFVEVLVQEWRAGSRTCAAAASILQGYLEALHEGMAAHLHITVPDCCVDALAATAVPRAPAVEPNADVAIEETLAGLRERLDG